MKKRNQKKDNWNEQIEKIHVRKEEVENINEKCNKTKKKIKS